MCVYVCVCAYVVVNKVTMKTNVPARREKEVCPHVGGGVCETSWQTTTRNTRRKGQRESERKSDGKRGMGDGGMGSAAHKQRLQTCCH